MRVIVVFKCPKASPITAAALLDGTIVNEVVCPQENQKEIRIGHSSGVMSVYPDVKKQGADMSKVKVKGVAVQRTVRRMRLCW